MKVAAFMGSPRKKGNSNFLVHKILETAEAAGAETQSFRLSKMDFRGCQACNVCKTKKDHCAIDDDMKDVFKAIRESDLLVFGTPIYFSEVSGQFKCFFDRLYSLFNPDLTSRLEPGKKSIFVITQGQPDEKLYAAAFERNDYWLKALGFKENRLIMGAGLQQEGEAEKRTDLIKMAEDYTREMLS
ncbi:MAG: flavodoxin family protein [Deltaproteobacteria bacterium]|nr:flavodoxin family protein [Deltaproteobacteria bacterium]